MKLEHIEVWNWQGLEHLCLPELAEGINLVVGPNGAGKSRLFRALQAVFFERYKGQAEHKKKWQTRGGNESPEVLVRFTIDGTPYSLRKRFLKGAEARLEGGGEKLLDGDAERRLQELMHTQKASTRGASLDQKGFWPLVWVEQHQSHNSPSRHLSEVSRGRLDDVLGEEAGQVAAGALGERILERVEGEYLEYWTGRSGKPTREYGRAIAQVLEVESALSEALSNRDESREQADRLSASLARLGALDEELQELDVELVEARGLRKQAETLAAELEKREDGVKLLKLELDGAQAAVAARVVLDRDLDKARAARAELEPRLQKAEKRVVEAESSTSKSEDFVGTAEEARRNADEAVGRAERQVQRIEKAAALTQAAEKLAAAEKDEKELRKLKARLAALDIDAKKLKALRKAERGASDAVAALNAAAARVRIKALCDTSLDGEPLADGDIRELIIDRERALTVGDVVEVTIEPGGEELTTRRDAAADAQRRLDERLERLGVASVTEASARLEERRGLEKEEARVEAALETRAPEGVEVLRATRDELASVLESLGPNDADAPEPNAAKASLKIAVDTLRGARAAREAARDERGEAREGLAALKRDAAALAATITELERRIGQQRDAAELEAEAAEARERLAEAERQRDLVAGKTEANRLDAADARCERLERAMARSAKERGQVKETADNLRGSLGSLDAKELHEKVQDAEANVLAAQKERDRLARRAEAVRVLREALRDAKNRTQQAVWSKVIERVSPYLEVVLPGSELCIEEGWEVAGVSYDDMGLEFDELSGGIREQVALVVRFALAESLAKDEPIPVVLDDPLVHTDPKRLRTMIDILDRASRKLQLLVLSCDEADYKSLGEERRFNVDQTGEVTVV